MPAQPESFPFLIQDIVSDTLPATLVVIHEHLYFFHPRLVPLDLRYMLRVRFQSVLELP